MWIILFWILIAFTCSSFVQILSKDSVLGISTNKGWISSNATFPLVPSNPNASLKTKVVLNYIVDLPTRAANRVLTGQFVGASVDNLFPTRYNTYITSIYSQSGKYPAIVGADFLYCGFANSMLTKLIEHSNNGGLVTISWHMMNPWTSVPLNCMDSESWGCRTLPRYDGCGESSDLSDIGSLSDLYTPGNQYYNDWHADLDQKAAWLATLRDNGVVVLFRPFHEMNGNWTWWENRDKAQYVALWQHLYNYYTNTKGLNNLLWVYSPNRNEGDYKDVLYYYPGKAYVDIVGLDYYYYEGLSQGWNGVISNIGSSGYTKLLTLGKPIALTEFGPGSGGYEPSKYVFDNQLLINNIKTYAPQTSYFMYWNKNYAIANQNNVSGLMNDSWSITRDEVDYQKSIDGVADFSVDHTSGIAPFTVVFTDLSTNNPQTYAWDFNNDGITDSTDANPSYIYTGSGTYTVRLTTQSLGISKTKVVEGLIIVSIPGGNTDSTNNNSISPNNTNSNNSATDDNGQSANSDDTNVFVPVGNENIFLSTVSSKIEGDYIKVIISYSAVNKIEAIGVNVDLDPLIIKEIIVDDETITICFYRESLADMGKQVFEIPIRIEDINGNYLDTVISTILPEQETQIESHLDKAKNIGIVVGTVGLMGITYTYITLFVGKYVVRITRRASGKDSDWSFF